VTIVIRRPVGVFVGLAVTAALVTACGSGPSQVGTALIVGNTSVSVNQVQQELNDLLSSQSAAKQAQAQGQLAQTSRSIVTAHVLHQLVGHAAAREGLTVSDPQIDQLVTQSGGIDKVAQTLGTAPADTRDVVKDVLLEAALARKYADRLTVKFGYVVATSRQDALTKAQQLAADPNSLQGLINQANSALAASGQQGSAGGTDTSFSISSYLQSVAQAEQQNGQAPTENDGPIFGTPANTVVAFQPDPSQGSAWIVALIKSRSQSGTAPAGGSATSAADLSTLDQIGVSLLQPDATELGVRISPRYGEWNQVSMQVVAAGDQNVGVEFPVRQPQP
jgi:hypothetical protein